MKKLKNILLTILVVALAALTVYWSVEAYHSKKALAAAQAQLAIDARAFKAAQVAIDSANAAIKKIEADAAQAKAQLETDAFNANLNAEKIRQKLAKVQSATPSALVTAAVSALGPRADVRYNGDAVVVGLETFRLIVTRLTDWADFTLVREPAYKKTVLDFQALVGKQDGDIAEQKVVVASKDKQLSALQDSKDALSKEIGTEKRATLIDKIELSGASFLVGIILGHVVK